MQCGHGSSEEAQMSASIASLYNENLTFLYITKLLQFGKFTNAVWFYTGGYKIPFKFSWHLHMIESPMVPNFILDPLTLTRYLPIFEVIVFCSLNIVILSNLQTEHFISVLQLNVNIISKHELRRRVIIQVTFQRK